MKRQGIKRQGVKGQGMKRQEVKGRGTKCQMRNVGSCKEGEGERHNMMTDTMVSEKARGMSVRSSKYNRSDQQATKRIAEN